MFFTTKPRYNPKRQRDEYYLTLKESFRDKAGRVHNRTMLTIGFLDEPLRAEDIRDISKALTQRYENRAYA